MTKKDIKYYVIIGIILVIIIVFEIMKPKPIDWRFTLEKEDKIPYGTFVLYNTLNDIFPGKTLETNEKTVFETYNYSDYQNKNYIFICEEFNPDKYDTETILKLAERGSNLFISAHYFSPEFSDTLEFTTDFTSFFDTLVLLNFYNTNIKRTKNYSFELKGAHFYFSSVDSKRSEILGHSQNGKTTFIKYKNGEGCLFVNTTPEAFTNYAMVTEKNYNFAYNALSYLPIEDVMWDEYYKTYRKEDIGPLNLIFTKPSFQFAYYLLLALTVIFVIFTAKRRQRIIPVLKPHENTSLIFIKTLGRLYYHSKNHKDIAIKKFNYLQHNILKKYHINITDNKNDYKIISEKTGADIETVKKVLSAYSKIHNIGKISAEELNQFNNLIEDFYETCK